MRLATCKSRLIKISRTRVGGAFRPLSLAMRIGAKWHPLPTRRWGREGVPLSPAMAAAAAASGGGLVVGVEKREGIGSAYVIA